MLLCEPAALVIQTTVVTNIWPPAQAINWDKLDASTDNTASK